jgi:hypothetical protein
MPVEILFYDDSAFLLVVFSGVVIESCSKNLVVLYPLSDCALNIIFS